ncbi:excinuclease ABC subunit UvrA [Collinsella tanakaei]|uniref:excinuclease ABC subunit UvrA n=1 Tax=Collinsella tanakaei TaxID=626935 RepID=UPI0025A3AFB2|nr:excinuclease ABC subunit UvrA [Collinsella tanakaei]MDM8246596.1 excinuclease ABC subunit UvrA [Collinsella tanakaei]
MKRTSYEQPTHIQVRGARVHNLKNIDVDIPLGQLVGIAGVSGSGKSSLALGTLYAEGSRRYLDALSTYTRRRIAQIGRATVDEVLHVPAALALRQRPGIPGVHSTFGTSTELLNYLRLLFSRLGSHVCPNGHRVPPSMDVALGQMTTCPVCGVQFMGPGAEDLAFNSGGACPTCGGTGIVRTVDEATLVPDESISIDDGAVLPWGSLMWDLMKQVCGAMGVRTNVPFCELTPEERDIVFHGPAEKKHILYQSKKGDDFAELDFTYFNAVYTVENALSKAKDEKGLARVSKFLREDVCPDCHGTRLSERARGPMVDGMTLADATSMTLDELAAWVPTVPGLMPSDMQAMAQAICAEMVEPMERLQQLGLGYLSLDRASSTLSTGERQRVQLARAVRNRTCGVLYVLDEPSIGLHPSNVEGLLGVVDDLLADGNSVVLVDHDVRVLRQADHLIEIGPGSGADGGRVIAQGTVEEVEAAPETRIGPFLSGTRSVRVRERAATESVFEQGAIHLDTDAIHTVKPLSVDIPRGRLTAVTGVSGSGKTTLVLESLIPGLRAAIAGEQLPAHVRAVDADGILRANLIDATPIGANVRSTVGTYSGVLDDLRRAYAKLPEAREAGLKAGAFSYNTGSLRCSTCDGTGQISLDVQFLPDVDIPCPECGGSRYARAAYGIKLAGDISLPELLSYTVDQAAEVLAETNLRTAKAKLQVLHDLGLGYLTLGEATPALSGGEAQRLKLASELTRKQGDALFVFDEPTIGLHPLDVEVLLRVLQRLIDNGATVVVIEHDLDMIANADYVIDMGPGGGEGGGRIVCAGTPDQVALCPDSITGRYMGK